MSLVNVLLKFPILISEIYQHFLLKKCEKLLQRQGLHHTLEFNKKVFFYVMCKALSGKLSCIQTGFVHYLKLYYNIINQVILYWPSYGSSICCIGPRQKAVGQYNRSRSRKWANKKLFD